MSIELPRSIKIGPIRFSVQRVKLIDGDPKHWGECSHTKANIKVKAGLRKQYQAVTLMHEIIHALLSAGGMKEMANDETAVEWLSENLTDTLWNSPGLLRYLKESKK